MESMVTLGRFIGLAFFKQRHLLLLSNLAGDQVLEANASVSFMPGYNTYSFYTQIELQ